MWWCIKRGFFGLWLVCLAGCHKPALPEGEERPPEGRTEVSIQYLKSLYKAYPLRITHDYVIRGRVVSNNRYRNFNRSFFVMDESGGIEVKIGVDDLQDTYPFGTDVLIRCAGLVLGSHGGSIQLGAASENEAYETGGIPASRMNEYIVSYGLGGGEPQAKKMGAAGLTMEQVGCLVILEGVQFIREEQGARWCEGEEYTERHLEFPETRDTVIVRTSPYAIFGSWSLPDGYGRIEGILTHFGGRYSLAIAHPERMQMDGERHSGSGQ